MIIVIIVIILVILIVIIMVSLVLGGSMTCMIVNFMVCCLLMDEWMINEWFMLSDELISDATCSQVHEQ